MSVLEDILAHQKAANERLYLIASENSPSINARLAFLTDIGSRYYFPLEKNSAWAFPGNEHLEKIYQKCRELICEATGAEFATIKPISGVSAMTIALASLARGGSTIATISPVNGGHSITSGIAKRLGIRVVYLPYDQEQFSVNSEALPEFIAREKVSFVYLDQCHILFPFPIAEMRRRIPESVKIYYDGSHVMGLIFGKNFQDPLKEGASFLGGSTHKTLPGPHKGFIATNDREGFRLVEAWSDVFVSHDHAGDVAALAIVLEEMRDSWGAYADRVVENATHLARELDSRGFRVLAKKLGFTRSHQVWVDTFPHEDAFEAVKLLARSNIITNTIQAPSLPERLALRVGVQELSYLGAGTEVMQEIAELFEKIIIKNEAKEGENRKKVAEIKRTLQPSFDAGTVEKFLQLIHSRN